MSAASTQAAFRSWNVAKTGRPSMTEGNWRYVKDILWYKDVDYARFVTTKDGTKICLNKNWYGASTYANVVVRPQEMKLSSGVPYLMWQYIPDIGVRSRFAGDVLSVSALHERLRFLFLTEIHHFKEDYVTGVTTPYLDRDKQLALLDKRYARYHNWSVIFGLDWPEAPKFYRQQVGDEIERRLAHYHDPKTAAARERAHARKIAKKAFGLA